MNVSKHSLTRSKTALVVGLLVLLSTLGCSSQASDRATEAELQGSFVEEGVARRAAWADQLQICAAHNGLSSEASRAYINSLGQNSSQSGLSAPTGDDAIRAQLARTGSGLIAGLQDDSLVRTIDRSQAGLDNDQLRIIESGPIDDPASNQSFDQGCAEWATRTVEGSDEFSPGVASERQYNEFLEDFLDGNRELAQLDQDWSACMAEQGFGPFERRGGHFEELLELRREVEEGRVEYSDALERDIDLSLANFACHVAIDAEARSSAVYDAAAEEFVNGG